MRTRFCLPPTSKRGDVEAALKYHYDSSVGEHQQFSYEWTRIHWFLQGIRNLGWTSWQGNIVPRRGGFVAPHYQDAATGQRKVRIERALTILQTEMGRLLSMDLGPAVIRRTGITLDAVRSAAVASAALDNFWARASHTSFRQDLAYQLCSYGTAGIGCFDAPPMQGVYGAQLAVIPAWELLPLPGGITGVDQEAGVCWRRWVPLQWLRDNYGDVLDIPKDNDKLKVAKQHSGTMMQRDISPRPNASLVGLGPIPGVGSGLGTSSGNGYADSRGNEPVDFVEMREGWVKGDDYSCLRWNVMLGDHLALDVDYTDEKTRLKYGYRGNDLPVCPVNTARYLTIGSFWGRGLLDRIIHMNRELELAVGDLLQDNRNRRRLTKMMLPLDSGIDINTMTQNADTQWAMWSPNLAAPEVKPFILEPGHGSAQILGNTVNLLNSIINETSQQGPTFAGNAPGRVDSSGAVQQIRQDQAMPLVSVGESLTSAMVGAYKSCLGIMRRRLPENPDMQITRIDESLIGIEFDRATGKLSISKDSIPVPQAIEVTVRSKVPVSREAKAAKLRENLQMGIINPVEYKILAIRDDLDTGILSRASFENYTSAWLDCVTLFHDGVTPGDLRVAQWSQNNAIKLMVVQEFMATPSFYASSVQVRNAFLQLKNTLETGMGGIPQQLTNLTSDGQPIPQPGMDQLVAAGTPPMAGGMGGPGAPGYPEGLSMLNQGR